LGQKTLFLRALGSKTGVSEHSKFTEISEILLFRTFQKLQKMTLKLNFGNREKLVLTQKPTWMFGLKFGMQGLIIIQCCLRIYTDPGIKYIFHSYFTLCKYFTIVLTKFCVPSLSKRDLVPMLANNTVVSGYGFTKIWYFSYWWQSVSEISPKKNSI